MDVDDTDFGIDVIQSVLDSGGGTLPANRPDIVEPLRMNDAPASRSAFADGALVCDLTLPFTADHAGREAALDQVYANGVGFISLTVGGDYGGLGPTLHNMADVRAMVRARADRMIFVRTVPEIRAARAARKLAVGFHFQGSGSLEANQNMVEPLYEMGVRHMLLVYNQMNAAASGCHERVDSGLSRHGLALVAEMNRVGMIVDCTHTGRRATMEMMEASSAPVIFSHSNARALFDHERNIDDEQALRCARGGGLVGVCGVGKFLSEAGTSRVTDMLVHIRYYADLLGPDHVCLGIDWVYFLEQMYRKVELHPDRWPKGYPPPPWHYFSPHQVPALADALLQAGFSDHEARGILGENFLRLAGQVWQ